MLYQEGFATVHTEYNLTKKLSFYEGELMDFYRFNKEAGKKVTHFNSDFIMSRVVNTDRPAHIGFMHLEENGVIGFHQAVVPQLLLIINGEGVSGKRQKLLLYYCFKIKRNRTLLKRRD